MSDQPKFVDATFFAVVVPVWAPAWRGKDANGRPILEGAKVEKITQTRPSVVRGGGVVTRLTLRLDSAALLPLQPQAVIHITPGQVEVIEVLADDPEQVDPR
jgi:hypothetical protein